VAFDGDGDRCVFVDETGQIISSDLMTALLVGPVLEQDKGASIIVDVCSSRVVREEVARLGGQLVEERVGHSFIKRTMREKNAPMAGESSGHYYWRDHWFADSALIATGRLLSLLTAKRQSLGTLMKPLRRTARSPEKNFHVEDKDAALERLVATFPGADVARVDGVTVRLEGWWFNARKSNTEPLLRVNAEADDAASLEAGMRRIEAVLGKPVVGH
jgi:phosphomannomutase